MNPKGAERASACVPAGLPQLRRRARLKRCQSIKARGSVQVGRAWGEIRRGEGEGRRQRVSTRTRSRRPTRTRASTRKDRDVNKIKRKRRALGRTTVGKGVLTAPAAPRSRPPRPH